jgi:hypothetical protein
MHHRRLVADTGGLAEPAVASGRLIAETAGQDQV